MSKISNIIVALIIVFNSCQDIKDNDDRRSKSSYLDTTCAKLPILHLKGSPYEIGFQHGSLMKTRINKLISKWKKDIEEKYKISSEL